MNINKPYCNLLKFYKGKDNNPLLVSCEKRTLSLTFAFSRCRKSMSYKAQFEGKQLVLCNYFLKIWLKNKASSHIFYQIQTTTTRHLRLKTRTVTDTVLRIWERRLKSLNFYDKRIVHIMLFGSTVCLCLWNNCCVVVRFINTWFSKWCGTSFLCLCVFTFSFMIISLWKHWIDKCH